ncbi:MAG: hypothetical protein WC596_00675 [Candidatus Shapirobacteria bacterium]
MTNYLKEGPVSVDQVTDKALRHLSMHIERVILLPDSPIGCGYDGSFCELSKICLARGYDRNPLLSTCPKLRGRKISL